MVWNEPGLRAPRDCLCHSDGLAAWGFCVLTAVAVVAAVQCRFNSWPRISHILCVKNVALFFLWFLSKSSLVNLLRWRKFFRNYWVSGDWCDLKKINFGGPLWHSRLRIQPCQCSSSGRFCGISSINPWPWNFRAPQAKKKLIWGHCRAHPNV